MKTHSLFVIYKNICSPKIMKILYIAIIFFVLYSSTNVHGKAFNEKSVVKIFVYNNIKFVEDENYPIAIPETGHGSGLLLSSDGVILTAKHVISDEETGNRRIIAVWVPGSQLVYPAEIIYKDDNSDFAFLYIEGEFDDYKALPKKPPKIKKESQTWVRGYPKDAWVSEPSTTNGIISRYIDELGWWQTDASINSGNSGGPVTDKKGNVIGIAVAKHRFGEGMGYILPLENIIKVYSELKKSNRIDNVKKKVANMSFKKKETKRNLSNFIAKVITSKNTLSFIEEFIKPDILNSFSNIDIKESSEDAADFLALSSAVTFDAIILTLYNNHIFIQNISTLQKDVITQIQEQLNASFFMMDTAIKINPFIKTESVEKMMNTINVLISYIAISKNRGKVIATEDNVVLIGLGSEDGIKDGNCMDIYSQKTNEKIATIKVTEVLGDVVSKSVVIGESTREISEGDSIKKACREGKVNRIDRDFVYIDLGSDDGVSIGNRLEVYSNITKRKIATIEIIKVFESFAKATINENYEEITQGDMVKFCTQ